MSTPINNTPMNLEEFVKVWNRNDNAFIKNLDGSIKISITSMSAMKFMMMLQSLYAEIYDFEVISGFEILATPKVEAKDNIENTEPAIEPGSDYTPEYEKGFVTGFNGDFYSLAERLDNDFVEIEVKESELLVKSNREQTLETMAKIVDRISEELTIEVYRNKLIIK